MFCKHFENNMLKGMLTEMLNGNAHRHTVYPKISQVVVMQSFIMNSHEVFIHIHQGCFAGTGAIVRLPQCQWSKPDGYGKISQCITTTKHSKAKTVCIFLGIYCMQMIHHTHQDIWSHIHFKFGLCCYVHTAKWNHVFLSRKSVVILWCKFHRSLLPRSKFTLTHWGWDKMDTISQTRFSNAFSWMKMY